MKTLNGHSLNGSSANGNGNGIKKGSLVRCLREGRWENGTVEQLLLCRHKGELYREYEIRLENGYRTWALAENFAPPATTRVVPTFLERLQKIARSAEHGENGA
jgi:hypothetical protein